MNIFSGILGFFSSLTRPKPARDWLFALLIGCGIFLCLASYAAHLYFAIDSGAAFIGAAPRKSAMIPITRSDIEKVLETYRTRSVNYAAHNIPLPIVVEPTK